MTSELAHVALPLGRPGAARRASSTASTSTPPRSTPQIAAVMSDGTAAAAALTGPSTRREAKLVDKLAARRPAEARLSGAGAEGTPARPVRGGAGQAGRLHGERDAPRGDRARTARSCWRWRWRRSASTAASSRPSWRWCVSATDGLPGGGAEGARRAASAFGPFSADIAASAFRQAAHHARRTGFDKRAAPHALARPWPSLASPSSPATAPRRRPPATALTARYGEAPEAEADVRGRAGRRRLHAGDAAPRPRPPPADLRHEPRLGRLPDERLRRGRPAGADRGGREGGDPSAGDDRASTPPASRHEALAINEVSLLRQTYQTAKLRILIDGKVRMAELICDGIRWSPRRPARPPTTSPPTDRSSRLSGQVLALTPISAFRPRRWRGALLSHNGQGDLRDARGRQAAGQRGGRQRRGSRCDSSGCGRGPLASASRMLFDAGRSLEERVLAEQFTA